MEKSRSKKTKDGSRGLFAMEDIEKDEFVVEYMRKIEYKKQRTM
jgi:hypothetical protein